MQIPGFFLKERGLLSGIFLGKNGMVGRYVRACVHMYTSVPVADQECLTIFLLWRIFHADFLTYYITTSSWKSMSMQTHKTARH